MDEVVLSLYARGLTTGEISAHFQEIYGADVSRETVSRITERVVAEKDEWCSRPLDRVYAAVFIDATVVKVRDGQVANRAFYVAVGVDLEGGRDAQMLDKWEARYPAIRRLWMDAWERFIPFLDYDVEIRRVICTTNAIESLNARFKRSIRARGHFPDEQAALKCMYLTVRSLDPPARDGYDGARAGSPRSTPLPSPSPTAGQAREHNNENASYTLNETGPA